MTSSKIIWSASAGWRKAILPQDRLHHRARTILGAAIVISHFYFDPLHNACDNRTRRPNPLRIGSALICFVWCCGYCFGKRRTVIIGSQVLHQPPFFLIVAVLLCFLFVLVNGISLGISDSNPISSAFVMTVFIMAALTERPRGGVDVRLDLAHRLQ
ncbi:MAG: OPT/YSL family transporter [Verrucomicrobiota bacterium]